MAGEANIWNPRTLLQLSANTKRIEEKITAIANQTLFTLVDFTYVVDTGALAVYLLTAADVALGLRGARLLKEGVDWTEGTISTFSLTVAVAAGDQIIAVGYVGITGDVDVRDTDIFVSNYQAVRDYVGTEITLYTQGELTKGDGGESFFHKQTGAAPGTFVDDGDTTVIPTGGDGSIGWLRLPRRAHNIATIAKALANRNIRNGDSVNIKEGLAGAGGAGIWDVVLLSSVTVNPATILAVTGGQIPALAIRLSKVDNYFNELQVGITTGSDMLAKLQACYDYMASGDIFELISATNKYEVSAPLSLMANVNWQIGYSAGTARRGLTLKSKGATARLFA